jgi:hypothetical protein
VRGLRTYAERGRRAEHVSATRRWRRLLACLAVDGVRVALAGATTANQTFADARRVGPRLITIDATLLNWSSTPNGEYRILHKGTSDGVCLPGSPRLRHEEPRRDSSRRTEFEEMTIVTLTVEAARQRLRPDNTARKGHADETERQRWMLSRLGRTTTQITPGVRGSNGNRKCGPARC